MVRHAEELIHDADILASSCSNLSIADAVIRVLAFEVLLKCVIYSETTFRPGGHQYKELWEKLPEQTRTELLAASSVHFGSRTDFSNIEDKFVDWTKVFMKACYYYEYYWDATFSEQLAEGDAWEASGASIEDAKVRFWPLELKAITEAILNRLKASLYPRSELIPKS